MADEEKINFHKAGLLLGSNLGNKEMNLYRAKELISDSGVKIIEVSSVYETQPWGQQDQPVYYNQAIVIKTTLSSIKLLREILKIEGMVGRERKEKWEPRIIDIDILFFDDETKNSPNLKIPHPELHKRKFALIPLSEIEPGWFHPVLNKNIQTLIQECNDSLDVKKLQ